MHSEIYLFIQVRLTRKRFKYNTNRIPNQKVKKEKLLGRETTAAYPFTADSSLIIYIKKKLKSKPTNM